MFYPKHYKIFIWIAILVFFILILVLSLSIKYINLEDSKTTDATLIAQYMELYKMHKGDLSAAEITRHAAEIVHHAAENDQIFFFRIREDEKNQHTWYRSITKSNFDDFDGFLSTKKNLSSVEKDLLRQKLDSLFFRLPKSSQSSVSTENIDQIHLGHKPTFAQKIGRFFLKGNGFTLESFLNDFKSVVKEFRNLKAPNTILIFHAHRLDLKFFAFTDVDIKDRLPETRIAKVYNFGKNPPDSTALSKALLASYILDLLLLQLYS